jgi:hypothetical protein
MTNREFHVIVKGLDPGTDYTVGDGQGAVRDNKFRATTALGYTKHLAKAMINNTKFTVHGVLNGETLKAAENVIESIKTNANTLIQDLAVHINKGIKPDNFAGNFGDPTRANYIGYNNLPNQAQAPAAGFPVVAGNIEHDKTLDHDEGLQQSLAKELMASKDLRKLYNYCKDKDLFTLPRGTGTVLTADAIKGKLDVQTFRNLIADSCPLSKTVATTILLRVALTVCDHITKVLNRISETYDKIMTNANALDLNTYSCVALSVINSAPNIRSDVLAFSFKIGGASDAVHTQALAVARTAANYNFADVDAKQTIALKKESLKVTPYLALPNYPDLALFYSGDNNISTYYTLAKVIVDYVNTQEITNLYTVRNINDTNANAVTLARAKPDEVYNKVFKLANDKVLKNDNNTLDIVIHIVKIAIVHQILESLSIQKSIDNNIIAKRNEMLITSPVTFNE